MIDINKIKKFANELKMRGVQYEHLEGSKNNRHWDGTKTVTNDEMRTMCSNRFGREYDLLTPGKKTKVRDEVFRQLRGEQNE